MDQHRVEDGEQQERKEREQRLVGVPVAERVARPAAEPRRHAVQSRRPIGGPVGGRLNAALEELGQRDTGRRNAHHHDDRPSSLRRAENLRRDIPIVRLLVLQADKGERVSE